MLLTEEFRMASAEFRRIMAKDETAKKKLTMDELLAGAADSGLAEDDSVQGKILSIKKNEIWVDLGAMGVGMVPRREIGYGKKFEIGQEVTASVVIPEMEDGYAVLSLRRAAKERGWDYAQQIADEGKSIEVMPYDANRGGLLIECEGVRGFMPVSQLSSEHYPHTSDKVEILRRLRELVGHPMSAQILDVDQKNNKLIFSEKEAVKEKLADRFAKLHVGDVVKGKVTGIVDFGAFVNIDGIEGLIHISEISWERIAEVSDRLKVGDEVEAKIIGIDKDRLSLSMKQNQPDPWLDEAKQYSLGDVVEGTITRITPFGAFVQLSPSIEALVHISELGGSNSPEKLFKLNEKKKFVVAEIDPSNRKISLGLEK